MINQLLLTLILYSILTFIILYTKPNFLYNEGKFKVFGISNSQNKSIIPFWLIILLISIISYVFSFIVVSKFR